MDAVKLIVPTLGTVYMFILKEITKIIEVWYY